jgi:hypothetical protein
VAVIQIADTNAGWRALESKFAHVGSSWPTTLKSPFWEKAALRYANVRAVPVKHPSPLWYIGRPFAVSRGLSTDSIYLARVDVEKLSGAQRRAVEVLRNDSFNRDSLYLLNGPSARQALNHVGARDLLAKVDDLFVFAPDGADLARERNCSF